MISISFNPRFSFKFPIISTLAYLLFGIAVISIFTLWVSKLYSKVFGSKEGLRIISFTSSVFKVLSLLNSLVTVKVYTFSTPVSLVTVIVMIFSPGTKFLALSLITTLAYLLFGTALIFSE